MDKMALIRERLTIGRQNIFRRATVEFLVARIDELEKQVAAQQSVQADGACTCALIKNETELVIDDLCPVHGSPRR